MRFNTLQEWLSWQETLHFTEIELGLDRVREVYQRLYSKPFTVPVISVAGTNGKGSSVAMLESIYTQAGYRVGCYTSPHLYQYNERIRINQQAIDDDSLCESFARIDAAREQGEQPISLTYFEFGTLAAFDIFHRTELNAELDVVILEVGLGGRLDVVNLIDAEVALITSIGLDHTEWLGDTREAIGYEKAGIMRAAKPVVCSDTEMPASIRDHAEKIKAVLYPIGQAFSYELGELDWKWSDATSLRGALPRPALIGEHQYKNAAGVLKVLELLNTRLPVSQAHVRQGLMDVCIDGRCQAIPAAGGKTIILDVAHNPDSIQSLAQIVREMRKSNLAQNKVSKIYALVGMMKDKALLESLLPMANLVGHWSLVKAPIERAAETADLAAIVNTFKPQSVQCFEQISEAFSDMQSQSSAGDILLVFGSFYTVSAFQQSWIST